MFQSPASSPAKGRPKDESHWRLGWWDFYPLIESPRRPLEWSTGASIFIAHTSLPLVEVHISPTRRFNLPSPQQIINFPNSYKPPTVICACLDNVWLFACFPGVEGTAPLEVTWKRGPKLDEWYIRESWSMDRPGTVVAARWIGTEREWVVNDRGALARLPRFGPHNPLNNPTLLLVTQSHHLCVCYFGHYSNSIKIVSCLLTRADVRVEDPHGRPHEISYGPGGVRLCTKASIGLRYNDSSILIAMQSRILPCPIDRASVYNTLEPNSSPTVPQHISSEYDVAMDWESWGEESAIELCEVQLTSDGKSLALSSQPLPALRPSKGVLANMTFMCTTPMTLNRPQAQTTASDGGRDSEQKGQIYLCSSFLEFGDYDSTPKSELVLHSLSRTRLPSGKFTWTTRHEATRSFSSAVLSFTQPIIEPTNSGKLCLFVGTLDTSGDSRHKAKDVVVGHVTSVKIPDLSDDGEWQPSTIVCPANCIGKGLPLIAASSPNGVLVCTHSPLSEPQPLSFHTLPTRIWKDGTKLQAATTVGPISTALAAAIRTRRSVIDLSSVLSVPSVHLEDVAESLYRALTLLDAGRDKVSETWAWEILGVAVEVYRMRLRRSVNKSDAGLLTAKWQTAHEICSLAACNMSFQECKEGDGYDLEAIWQLVALSTWIVNFVEKLMKDCIVTHANDMARPQVKVEDGDDLFGSVSPSPKPDTPIWEYPTLLHLVQPYALSNLCAALKNVVVLHGSLRALSAKEENIQMAKDVFLDLIEYSGIKFNDLESLLSESLKDSQAISVEDARRSLALCQPTSSMMPILRNTIQRLAKSDVLDKAALFIKASDIVNGTTRPPMIERVVKEREKDVVSKGVMMKNGPIFHCRRCDGQSEIGDNVSIAGHISRRWNAWERAWAARCICGGMWYISK